MRILWLSHLVPYPPKGGVLQRSYHLIHEMSKYHEIDLIAFNQPSLLAPIFDSPQEGLQIAERELGKFCNILGVFDIPAARSKLRRILLAFRSLFTEGPYNINWLQSLEYKACVKHAIESETYDLVHFDTISLVPYFSIVGKIPTILDHHNIESSMLIRRAEKETSFLKKAYFTQEGRRLEEYERKFCQKFSLNITCSDTDTAELEKISPDANVVTVPNGVDVDFFRPVNMTDDSIKVASSKRIVFIGRLNWYPNAEAVSYLAAKIWPLLKAREPDVECDIIGANPPEVIKELAQSDEQFRVHGFVDDIFPFMAQSTVYVCPITNGGGTKLKVLDALAMGMPLVAHPFACEGIDVKDGENVLFADNEQSFVDAIVKLMSDRDFAKKIGDDGRRLIEEKYSYQSIGKEFSDYCAKLV